MIIPKNEFYSLEEWIRKRIQEDNMDVETLEILKRFYQDKSPRLREICLEEIEKRKCAPIVVKEEVDLGL